MDTSYYFFFVYVPVMVMMLVGLHMVSTHLTNKLRNFPPSPATKLPILGHLQYFLDEPIHRSLAKASDIYGPVLLLQLGSRRILHVSSPSAAEECFRKNDVIFANRPRFLTGKHFGYNHTSLVWSPHGEDWRNLRRLTSMDLLSNYRLQMINGEITCMTRRLIDRSGEAMEVKTLFFETLMNVMTRMMIGKTYYSEKADDDEAKRFRQIVSDSFPLSGSWSVGDFFPISIRWAEKKLAQLQGRMDSFFQEIVQECKDGMRIMTKAGAGKKETTMLEMLLALQEKEPAGYYTDEMIRSLLLNLLAAGTDTSASTCEWALSLLLNHPQVMEKAKTEIEQLVGQQRLIEDSDISNIPYIRCIINETMRMYPIGPFLFPHESSDKCWVGGYCVPAKTILLVNVWAIQNDPKQWEDPGKFRPERFQANRPERYNLMPFGTGRRSCPGEGLALRMVGLVLGSIIQCFEWERIGNDPVDMSEGVGGNMSKLQPLVAYCKPRPFLGKLLS